MKRALTGLALFLAGSAFAWGELGHQIVARMAARILPFHPAVKRLEAELGALPEEEAKRKRAALALFLETYRGRALQQAHLANIPDTYWRNLEPPFEEDGQLLGDFTHFLNPERIVDIPSPEGFFKTKIPLSYAQAKEEALRKQPDLKFFQKVGTLPWRAQQLASLHAWSLENYPDGSCDELRPLAPHPTQIALAYAGVLSHETGDASQPFHVTTDYDGVGTGQKGLHSYFEDKLVYTLEGRIELKVEERARRALFRSLRFASSVPRLHEKARAVYGHIKKDEEVTALLLALAADSYRRLNEVRRLDRRYALATLAEARAMAECHALPAFERAKAGLEKAGSEKERRQWLRTKIEGPTAAEIQATPSLGKLTACRRQPSTQVGPRGEPASNGGRAVADWHAELILDRLAIGAAVTADIWARAWIESGQPGLCWTWRYAHKPSFVSPTDAQCFGYALKEDPKDFLKKDGTSALPWKKGASSTDKCATF